MGDGILSYFGYPRAHEDDAERGANREAVSLLDEALQIVERTGDAMVRSGVEQA
jgi:class 3 adenylate cyclase